MAEQQTRRAECSEPVAHISAASAIAAILIITLFLGWEGFVLAGLAVIFWIDEAPDQSAKPTYDRGAKK